VIYTTETVFQLLVWPNNVFQFIQRVSIPLLAAEHLLTYTCSFVTMISDERQNAFKAKFGSKTKTRNSKISELNNIVNSTVCSAADVLQIAVGQRIALLRH
jgi:hypothetical protein